MNYSNKKVVSKGRRKKEKVKTAQRFAEKAVNTVESIKDTVMENAESLKDRAVYAVQETGNSIKNACEKAEGVKKDFKDGFHEASQDMKKMDIKISKDLKNP